MIGSLRGRIVDKELDIDKISGQILIDVAGVGYQVTVTAGTFSNLLSSDEITIYVHHHIRENDQKLFGFISKEERLVFKGLINTHGIGPSMALAVLATFSISDLSTILSSEDIKALCEVPGIGKKTAQRLIVELKSSLVLPDINSKQESDIDLTTGSERTSLLDVRQALESLGYSSEEIKRSMAELRTVELENVDTGDMLKLALKSLGGD